MFDMRFWRQHLPLLVQGYGGYCAVRIVTYPDDEAARDYLVRGVIKTEEGYGIFDCYLDKNGECPIEHSTSSTQDWDMSTPFTSKAVALPYENIADVQVMAVGAARADVKFH